MTKDKAVEKGINFKVNCRDCKKPMHLASKLLENTLFCSNCKLKAKVEFSETPVVVALKVDKE